MFEMQEIIKIKIDKIQDVQILGKINEMTNTTYEKPSLSAEELFEFIVSRFDETLKKMAQ
jgi:hypothetical protein